MLFLKVPRKLAEKTRLELLDENLFSSEYAIFSEGDFIFIPVKGKWKQFELVEREAEKLPPRTLKLKELLSEFLTEDEMEKVYTAFDIIGDIAIVEIPKELESKDKQIGEALLKVHRNLKTVFKKASAMEGEYRVRKLKHIAGEERTVTVYREHGCDMKLDVTKVYFSVRLSHERNRIAGQVKDGEKILALFAGVGPFPLVISRKHPNTDIIAIELNPDAVRYLEENVRINGMDNIKIVPGDAREIVMKQYLNFADRILMPLPRRAEDFLDVAFAGAKDGAIIHFYTMASVNDPFGEALEKAEKHAKDVSLEVLSQRIVRPYAPAIVQVVLDLKVKKPQ